MARAHAGKAHTAASTWTAGGWRRAGSVDGLNMVCAEGPVSYNRVAVPHLTLDPHLILVILAHFTARPWPETKRQRSKLRVKEI